MGESPAKRELEIELEPTVGTARGSSVQWSIARRYATARTRATVASTQPPPSPLPPSSPGNPRWDPFAYVGPSHFGGPVRIRSSREGAQRGANRRISTRSDRPRASVSAAASAARGLRQLALSDAGVRRIFDDVEVALESGSAGTKFFPQPSSASIRAQGGEGGTTYGSS